MDIPGRMPADVGSLLERLLDEAELGEARNHADREGLPPPVTEAVPAAPVPLPMASEGASAASPVGLLGGILGNPAMMAALPSLLENLGPLLGGGRTGGDTSEKRKGPPVDRHTALLCAVKPYLGAERRAAAETVLRLCRIWDALAKSGVTLGGLGAMLGSAGSVGSPSIAHTNQAIEAASSADQEVR